MIIYIILLLAIVICPSLIKTNLEQVKINNYDIKYTKKYNYKKMYIVFISILLTLLLFLKHDYVGTDTQNYRWNFISTNINGIPNNIDINTEIGFILLQLLIGKLGGSFRIMLLVVAVIYIYAVSKLIYKYSDIPWLSYFLFLCMGFFIFNTTIRQSIALSFSILAFISALDKKLLKYLILCCIACTFHTSALIIFPLYWICKLKWNQKTIIYGIGVLVFILLFRNQIVTIILSIDNEFNYIQSKTGGYTTILMYSSFIFAGILCKERLLEQSDNNKNFFYMMGLVILVFPISKFNPALSRVYMYFSIYMIIYIPNIIRCLKDIKLKNLVIVSFIILGLFNFFYKTNTYGIRLIPYVFFWQEYPSDLLPNGLLPAGKW